jgi:hypothetical protein
LVNVTYLLNYEEEHEKDFDVDRLTIKCATLERIVYKPVARKVHQLIYGFLHREPAEAWIQSKEKERDARIDFEALIAYSGVEGDKSVRIKEADEAEVLRKSLQYRNKRSM